MDRMGRLPAFFLAFVLLISNCPAAVSGEEYPDADLSPGSFYEEPGDSFYYDCAETPGGDGFDGGGADPSDGGWGDADYAPAGEDGLAAPDIPPYQTEPYDYSVPPEDGSAFYSVAEMPADDMTGLYYPESGTETVFPDIPAENGENMPVLSGEDEDLSYARDDRVDIPASGEDTESGAGIPEDIESAPNTSDDGQSTLSGPDSVSPALPPSDSQASAVESSPESPEPAYEAKTIEISGRKFCFGGILQGTEASLEITEAGTGIYVVFRPAAAGIYKIYSTSPDEGYQDTCGYVCSSSGTVLFYNDDSYGSRDFKMMPSLKAGTDYLIAVNLYDAEDTGSISLHVEKATYYTVSYDAGEKGFWENGAERMNRYSTEIAGGETIFSASSGYPGDPVPSGNFGFEGWADADGNAVELDDYTVTGSVTFYARWKLYSRLTLMADGYGKFTNGKTSYTLTRLIGRKCDYLSDYFESVDPLRRFIGWSTDAAHTDVTEEDSFVFTEEDKVLYAVTKPYDQVYEGKNTVRIREGESLESFLFKPAGSGYYKLRSAGSQITDPNVCVCDSRGNELTFNDDSGDGWQFKALCAFTKGATYRIDVGSGNDSGNLQLYIEPVETVAVTFDAGSKGHFDYDRNKHKVTVHLEKGTSAASLGFPGAPQIFYDELYGFIGWKDSTGKLVKLSEQILKEPVTFRAAYRVVAKVTLAKTSVTVKKTASASVNAVLSEGSSLKSVSSGNTKIATASFSGKTVKIKAGKTAGSTTVTVTSSVGVKAKLKVTVPKAATTALKAAAGSYSVPSGKTVQIKVSVTPAWSDDKVTYKSSDKSIAAVSAKGLVKGVKPGKATITATSGKKTVKIKIVVKKVPSTGLTTSRKAYTVKVGKTIRLNAKKLPKNSTDKIHYSSSNKTVATVNASGVVRGKKKGNVVIVIRSGKISKKVKVKVV